MPTTRKRAFGRDDDGEMTTRPIAFHDLVTDLPNVVRNLGDEDDVGGSSKAAMQRNESGVAAHDFHHDHAIVTFGRGVKLVDRLERGVHRRVEPERRDRSADIVVDRLGHADDFHAALVQTLGDRERSIASDRDDSVDSEAARALEKLGRPIDFDERPIGLANRIVKRVTPIRRVQDRAAQVSDPAH